MNTSSSKHSLWRKSFIAVSLAAGLISGAHADSAAVAPLQPHSDSVGAALSDSAITAKVKSQFVGEDRLKNSSISVTTVNGVVTLTGSASGPKAKAAAEQIADGVDGVRSVENDLQAATHSGMDRAAHKSERVASDSWITAKVKSEIMADSVSQGFDVSVTTTHGVVMLKGDLADQGAIDHVKDLAERIKGVKSVDASLLRIAST